MPGSVSRVVATVLGTRVDTAFALMGNGNAWLIDALPTAGIAVVPVRHEAATVAAADAYGRASRRLAVATTTYGPGFTNALTPLAEAALARTPLLLVAGGPPTSGLRDFDVDQMGMARACGAQVFAATAADAATVTRQALDAVADGPVVLLLPDDQAELPTVSSEEPAPAPEDHPGPDVREAARLLAQANLGGLVRTEQRKVLGQRHQLRAGTRGLGHEAGGDRQVFVDLRPRHGLHRGDPDRTGLRRPAFCVHAFSLVNQRCGVAGGAAALLRATWGSLQLPVIVYS